MPKKEKQNRIDQQGLTIAPFFAQSGNYDPGDPADTTAPATPTGVSVRAVQDGVLIEVDFNTDTAHDHSRFKHFIVYVRPVGSSDATGYEVGRFDGSAWVWHPKSGGYTGWEIALTAISESGEESGYTSWYQAVVNAYSDDFARYGGSTVNDATSLYWLKISDFDTSWSGGGGALSDDTTYYRDGDMGQRLTNTPGAVATEAFDAAIDLSTDGRWLENDDKTCIVCYVSDDTNVTAIEIRYRTDASNYYTYTWSSGYATGWNYLTVAKSSFSTSGSPNWNSIADVAITITAAGGAYATFDDWRIVRYDPDNDTVHNDTGQQWDFQAGTWHIYDGNRDGEADRAYALGQIDADAGDDFLAEVQDVSVTNGRLSAGVYFKDADGRGGLAFRIEDDTLGSEDMLTLEVDTNANTLYLVSYVAGAKTTLDSGAYTCAQDTLIWLGVDFEDSNNEGRINCHIADNQNELFSGDSLLLSYTEDDDTYWPDGYGIGLVTLEANTRFVSFNCGTLTSAGLLPHTHASHTELTEPDDHTQYWLLAGETTDGQLHSGADLIVYSDAGSTEVARIDGATGNITTIGTVDGVDVSEHDHSGAGQGGTVDHADLSNVTANQHHNQAHDIEGADHTATGLTIGHVLRATGATSFAFQAITSGDLPAHTHTEYFELAGETTDAELHSGADLIGYSDAGSTETVRVDTSAGNVVATGFIAGGTGAASDLDLIATTDSSPTTASINIGNSNTPTVTISSPAVRCGSAGTDTVRMDADDAISMYTPYLQIGDETATDISWRIGDTPLSLDFTGALYDSKSECNAVGLRFSDSDTPFPSTLRFTVGGTWSHTASTGWLAAPGNDQMTAIVFPLMRSSNWALTFTLNYDPTAASHRLRALAGYITSSNTVGAHAHIIDNSASSQLTCYLVTNDDAGNSNFTNRYTGSALSGTGTRLYGFKSQNGALSVYDEQDDAWHDYEGHQSTSASFTAAYAFIGFYKYTSYTFARTYLRSLTVQYLV